MLDRHGNKIKIFAGSAKEEIELSKSEIDLLLAPIRKWGIRTLVSCFPISFVRDDVNLTWINKISTSIRLTMLKKKLKMKELPEYIKFKLGKKLEIKFFLYGHWWFVLPIIVRDQYNMFPSNMKGKTMMDIGANVGFASLYAAALGASKVYAFEPLPSTYELLQKNIKLNMWRSVIISLNKAVGDVNTIENIYFRDVADADATLNKKLAGKRKKQVQVHVVTLDNFVRENKIPRVDFVKIDAEGYEEKILLGAKETIRKYKPILSLSAYHFSSDKEKLPQIVKSIRSDYKIDLFKFGDEVFYCY